MGFFMPMSFSSLFSWRSCDRDARPAQCVWNRQICSSTSRLAASNSTTQFAPAQLAPPSRTQPAAAAARSAAHGLQPEPPSPPPPRLRERPDAVHPGRRPLRRPFQRSPPSPRPSAPARMGSPAGRQLAQQDWRAAFWSSAWLCSSDNRSPDGPVGIVTISLAGSWHMLAAGVIFEPRDGTAFSPADSSAADGPALYVTVYSMHAVTAAKVIDSPVPRRSSCSSPWPRGMIAHSLKYRSEIVTGLAYFIAFFTLVITQITTLSLIALIPLAASLLFIAHHFKWSQIALGGLVATYITVALRPDNGAPLWEAQAIFTVYWLMFEVFDILQADSWLLPLNAAGFLGLSLIKWQRADPDHIWRLLAAAAAAYLVSALLRARRGRVAGRRNPDRRAGCRRDLPAAGPPVGGLRSGRGSRDLLSGRPSPTLVVSALDGELPSSAGSLPPGAPRCGRLPVDTWAPVAALDAVVFYANRFLCPADFSTDTPEPLRWPCSPASKHPMSTGVAGGWLRLPSPSRSAGGAVWPTSGCKATCSGAWA